MGLPSTELCCEELVSAGSPLRDEPSLEDLAGHSLPFDEVLRFTTGDGQPPILVRSSPMICAIGVNLDSICLPLTNRFG